MAFKSAWVTKQDAGDEKRPAWRPSTRRQHRGSSERDRGLDGPQASTALGDAREHDHRADKQRHRRIEERQETMFHVACDCSAGARRDRTSPGVDGIPAGDDADDAAVGDDHRDGTRTV